MSSDLEPGADQTALVVPNNVIESTVARINRLARETTLKLAQEVGRIVVEEFYRGDLEVLRRRGAKDASLRKLAEHPSLSVSASDLHRSIGIYELCDRLGVWDWQHLTKSHFRAVMGLPEKKQARILQNAEEKQLTVAQIEREAKKARKSDGRGRPPLPAFQKAINRFDKLVESGELVDDLDKLETMDTAEIEALYKKVTGAKLAMEQLQEALKTRVPGFTPEE